MKFKGLALRDYGKGPPSIDKIKRAERNNSALSLYLSEEMPALLVH
jgi:hypothetical protein